MSPLTIEKATNTDDTDEYSELKKLTEQNTKLTVALEAERKQFVYFLSGVLNNLRIQNKDLENSLDHFKLNIVEHQKLNIEAKLLKSITFRPVQSDAPEVGGSWGTVVAPRLFGSRSSVVADHHDATTIGDTPLFTESRRIAEIRPTPRDCQAKNGVFSHLRRDSFHKPG